ncbi:MAG: hypothetical protein EB125_06250 [Betaproteobacteria bacterium]|nr:hypothetical protein [Betaproteobacteria bacterium]
MNEAKVRALVDNIHDLMALHERQKETYIKLFKLCAIHLEDRRRLIPEETWAERKQLITAIKELTGALNEHH